MNKNFRNAILVTLTTLTLAACGGGGSGGSEPTKPNPTPTPNNSPKLTVSTNYVNIVEGEEYIIDLTKSDKDNDVLSYNVVNNLNNIVSTEINNNKLIIIANEVNLTTSLDLKVELTDNKSTVSENITVVVNDITENIIPELGLEKTAITMQENSTANITLNGVDAEGDVLEYSVINNNEEIEVDLNSESLVVTSNEVSETEEFEIILTVNDGKNESAQSILIIVNNKNDENRLPTLEVSSSELFVKEKEKVSLTINANDEDGDSLTYGVIGNSNIVATIDGSTITVEAKKVNTDLVTSITALVNDGKNTVSKDIKVNIENIPNRSPIVSLDKTDLDLEVSEEVTVSANVSDPDGDTNLYSNVTSNNNNVATVEKTNNGFTVKGVSEGVAVITYSVRDSENATGNAELTVTVIENTAPIITLNPREFSMTVNSTATITATISDAEKDETESSIAVNNPSVISAGLDNSGNVTVTALSAGVAVVTYTVTDEGGLSSTAEATVTVVEGTNEAPDFTIVGQVEGLDQVSIYHDRETTLNISIVDPDSDAHYISLVRFEAVQGSMDLIENYEINNQNKTMKIIVGALPTNMDVMVFEMELNVRDDSNNDVTKTYELFVEKSENATPIFSFPDKEGAFIVVPQNGTKEFTYTIQDDDVSKVEVTGTQYWYGDQSKFSVQLDADTQTITVTTNGGEVEEAYGFVLQYVDSSLTGNVNVELIVGAEFGADEQEMLDLKHEMIKAREAVKEYVYIGAFYSQVLENLGYITEQQAEDFVERLDVDDSDNYSYGTLNLYINNIDYYITIGEFKDQGFKESYITVINSLLNQAKSMGQTRYAIINEMAALSGDTLPTVNFEREFTEYDTENNYFSRFTGNTAYGEYVDGVWVFDSQYSFMDAVNAQMVQNALRNIGS